MDDETRKIIDSFECRIDTCLELVVKILDLMEDNVLNNMEKHFVIDNLKNILLKGMIQHDS